jgi:antitoxin CcdA
MKDKQKTRRRPLNLTIRTDIIEEAKAYNINASEVSEIALAAAVKKAKEDEWLKQAAPAIKAHNERVRKTGPLLNPHWMDN